MIQRMPMGEVHSHYITEDGWVYVCNTYGRLCELIPSDLYRTPEESKAQMARGLRPDGKPA